MVAVLLALVLALLLEQGNASHARIAGTSEPREAWIMIAAATVTTALAAIGGGALAPMLSPEARLLFLALALGFAATGLLLSLAAPSPALLGASGGRTRFAVFVARRAGENVLLVVGAVAAFTGNPVLTATGGAAGSFAALYAATLTGPAAARSAAARAIRGAAGTLLLLAAIFAAASALRVIA